MDPVAKSLVALDGLSIGDAFGQCFFQLTDPDEAIAARLFPESLWLFTDETEMSLSVVNSFPPRSRCCAGEKIPRSRKPAAACCRPTLPSS